MEEELHDSFDLAVDRDGKRHCGVQAMGGGHPGLGIGGGREVADPHGLAGSEHAARQRLVGRVETLADSRQVLGCLLESRAGPRRQRYEAAVGPPPHQTDVQIQRCADDVEHERSGVGEALQPRGQPEPDGEIARQGQVAVGELLTLEVDAVGQVM